MPPATATTFTMPMLDPTLTPSSVGGTTVGVAVGTGSAVAARIPGDVALRHGCGHGHVGVRQRRRGV